MFLKKTNLKGKHDRENKKTIPQKGAQRMAQTK
jgi:hypothetical protein